MKTISNIVTDTSISRKIVVHLGAHRTGTTLFQEYIYNLKGKSSEFGHSLVGIDQTRQGMMEGLLGQGKCEIKFSQIATESLSRLESLFVKSKDKGEGLLLSDENIIGSMERNLATCSIYQDLPEKLYNFKRAFRHVDRFYLSIRDLESWWNSCLSYLISVNTSPPKADKIEAISVCNRSWRHVVIDIMHAYPNAEIYVRDFDFLIGNPKQQLIRVTGSKIFNSVKNLKKKSNEGKSTRVLRKSLVERNDISGASLIRGEGKFKAFDEKQSKFLRDSYKRDILWMRKNLIGNHKFLEPNIY